MITRLLLFLFAGVAVYAQAFSGAGVISGAGTITFSSTNTGPVYVLEETFDGAGDPDGAGTVWTSVGTVDYDYVTAPAPLEGTQSLYEDGSAVTATVLWNPTSGASAAREYYVKFRITSALVSSAQIIQVRDASSASVAYVSVSSGNTLRIRCGTAYANSGTSISTNTTYHLWVRYETGTGANAVATLGFSEDGNRPTYPLGNYAQVTTGTSTTDAEGCALAAWTGQVCIFDDLKVTAGDVIPSDP